MDSQPTTLGGMLKAAREKARLNQNALGRKIGESRQRISAWENDKNRPRLKAYDKIVKQLEQILDPQDELFISLDRIYARGELPESDNPYRQRIEDGPQKTVNILSERDNSNLIDIDNPPHTLNPPWLDITCNPKIIKKTDPEVFKQLCMLRERHFRSWLAGNYNVMEVIGKEFCAVADYSGDLITQKHIAHIGHFLIGEAKRLQWLHVESEDMKTLLLREAMDEYQYSNELEPKNFRTGPGIAKIYFEQGDYSKSIVYYDEIFQKSQSVKPTQVDWDIARHEELRAGRGRIDLLTKIGGTSDLINQILLCREKNIETLKEIGSNAPWSHLELFISYTFLGGAIAVFGINKQHTDLCRQFLKYALMHRIVILDSLSLLDKRLRQNLEWWQSKVLLIKHPTAENALIRLSNILRGDEFKESLKSGLLEVANTLK